MMLIRKILTIRILLMSVRIFLISIVLVGMPGIAFYRANSIRIVYQVFDLHTREVSGARLLLVVPDASTGISFLAARAIATVAHTVKA